MTQNAYLMNCARNTPRHVNQRRQLSTTLVTMILLNAHTKSKQPKFTTSATTILLNAPTKLRKKLFRRAIHAILTRHANAATIPVAALPMHAKQYTALALLALGSSFNEITAYKVKESTCAQQISNFSKS